MTRTLSIFLVLMLALAGLMPGSARAQAGTIGDRLGTCVMRDAAGLDAATLFRAPSGFDCRTPQTRFGPGDYWVMSGPVPTATPMMQMMVRSASVWQQGMTLYALYPGGKIVAIPTDGPSVTRNIHLGAIVQFWLPRSEATPIRLLWHIKGAANLRGILIAPTIATARQAARSDMVLAAIYAAFAGICAALLLYNLGLARALRSSFLPLYCLMMVGMLLYAFSSSGALAWVLPDIDNNARLRINYLMLAATAVAAINFLRHFFEARVMSLWLERQVQIASLAVTASTIAFAVFSPWHIRALDTAYCISFVILLVTVIPIMISAWQSRSEFLWLFAIAWSAPIVLATVRTAYGLNLIGYNFWVDNSTMLSMAFEAVLSSLAIAYRILLITRERDLAREQEISARMLADTDALTALMNRRAFLREAIGRPGTQQLLIIDIDNFKTVNETIGHDGGDEVLRLVARVLRGAVHADALVARIGGEEFAIVAPSAHPIAPDDVLSALRTARMPFDLKITASIGTCTGPLRREADWKAMYGIADKALFEAKSAGRDRTRAGTILTPPSAMAA